MKPADFLDAAEQAFSAAALGKAWSPLPMHLPAERGGFHAKGASISLDRDYVAVKINGNFPGNPAELGLPTIQGAIVLCEGRNGTLLAILDFDRGDNSANGGGERPCRPAAREAGLADIAHLRLRRARPCPCRSSGRGPAYPAHPPVGSRPRSGASARGHTGKLRSRGHCHPGPGIRRPIGRRDCLLHAGARAVPE